MAVHPARLSSYLLVLACLTWPTIAASQTSTELVAAYYDSVTLSGKLQGAATDYFVISVKCARFQQVAHGSRGPSVYIGTDGYNPHCIVQALTLTLNGKSVPFPAKSYADLADVNVVAGIYLTTRGNSIVVHVQGGDGAASYEARFVVERQRLVTREIEQMNAKGEAEVTKQSF